MTTTDLKLDEPGSLLASDGNIRAVIWNGLLPGIFLVSYIINIGYSRAWKKWPAIISAAVSLHTSRRSHQGALLSRRTATPC